MSILFGPSGNSNEFYDEGKKSTLEAPKWVKDKGLDAYEYSAGNGIKGNDTLFSSIGKESIINNIHMSFHTPYFISLSGIDEEKRLKSIDYIRSSIHAAELMNCETIVIHCGSASKISRSEAMNLSKDTLYKALCEIPSTKIKYGIETMGKINQLGTLEEVVEICKIDKRLCPVVDFGHLNARSLGELLKSKDDYKRIFEYIGSNLGYEYSDTLHCHFSKIEYGKSGEIKHLTFEDNEFGPSYELLIDAIIEENYSPCIICESAGTQSKDALIMKNYYKNNK
jgi:deoxyribonuclease-4